MNLKKQARNLFPQSADEGYTCECCGMFIKRYFRSFNSNMALALIALYKNKEKGYVHVENTLAEMGYKRCGDASYLQHYNLITPLKEEREDGSPRNGYYKITALGMLFVEKKSTVAEKFIMFKGKFEGFEGKEINIEQALNKKFIYLEIMNLIP